MRRILRTLALLSAGAMMIVPMSPAQGATERIAIACTAFLVSQEGAREWVGGPTWHGRNGVETNRTVGSPYCAGKVVVGPEGGFNASLVLEAWGTIRYELDAFPGSGFEGTWHLQFNLANQGEGEELGKGYGDLGGWQIRTSFQLNPEWEDETDIYYWVSGYVFNPGG